MAHSNNNTLSSLSELQKPYELSIITLSESIAPEFATTTTDGSRTSEVSNDSVQASSPTSLEADLAHYKDLFSKLRFSYLEQVTKEKFLRAILDEPPLVVEHEENVVLEAGLTGAKSALKAQKAEVAQMVTDLESQSGQLSRRHERVQGQISQARALPASISDLQASIDSLRTATATDENPSQSLPLAATLSLVSQQKVDLERLNGELAALDSTLLKKTRELERMETELRPLETQRQTSIKAAEEARRRKAGLEGDGDDLEQRGRWWKAVNEGLQEIVKPEA